MHRNTLAAAAALLIVCGMLNESHAQANNIQDEIPLSSLQGFAEQYDAWTPDLGNRQFQVARGGFSTRFDLGCSGVPQFGMLTNVGTEVERIFEYLQANALGLAVNYLVYRNPTLYSFLQNLNQKYSFLSNQMVMSCSSVREDASETREESRTASQAVDACLAEGQTPEHCNLASNIGGFAASVQAIKQGERDRIAGKADASVVDVVNKRLTDDVRSSRVIGADSFGELIESVTPQTTVGSGGGGSASGGDDDSSDPESAGTSTIAPESDMEEYLIEASVEYAKVFDAVIDCGTAPSDLDRGLCADGLEESDFYEELDEDPTTPRVTPGDIQRLFNLREKRPDAYRQVLAVFARKSAMASAEYQITRYEVAVRDAEITMNPETVGSEEWQMQHKIIESLRSQVELAKMRDKGQREILKAVRAAREAS